MAGGKSPKRKGDAGEREVIALLGGERTFWQPEQAGAKEKRGDVFSVPCLGRGEVKRRRDGFRQIYHWLEDVDFVAMRADRKGWLVALRMEDLMKLLQAQKVKV